MPCGMARTPAGTAAQGYARPLALGRGDSPLGAPQGHTLAIPTAGLPGRQVDTGFPVRLYPTLQIAVQLFPGAWYIQLLGHTPFVIVTGNPAHDTTNNETDRKSELAAILPH